MRVVSGSLHGKYAYELQVFGSNSTIDSSSANHTSSLGVWIYSEGIVFTARLVRLWKRCASPRSSEYVGNMSLGGRSVSVGSMLERSDKFPCPADVSAPSNMSSDWPNALRVAAGYRRSKEKGEPGGSSTKLWG